MHWFYSEELGLYFNNPQLVGMAYSYEETLDTCHICLGDVADCEHAVERNRRREERILECGH